MVSYYKEAASQVEPGNEFSFSPSVQHSVTCCLFPSKIFCRWFWPFTELSGPRIMTYIPQTLLVQPSLIAGRVSEIVNLTNYIDLQKESLWRRYSVSFSAKKVSFAIINSFKWFEILQTGFVYHSESFLLMQNWVRYFKAWKNWPNLHSYSDCYMNWHTKKKKIKNAHSSAFIHGPKMFSWKSSAIIFTWYVS